MERERKETDRRRKKHEKSWKKRDIRRDRRQRAKEPEPRLGVGWVGRRR